MAVKNTKNTEFSFDKFRLDLTNRRLLRDGEVIPLNSKYLDVLILLAENSGQLMTKEYIFEKVWGNVIVSDAALSQCIKDIRRALGDSAGSPRYIKTIPKHGYTFLQQITSRAGIEQTEISKRPYKFLDYYTENDAAMFFGRETEITQICSKILAHRSFIIHGKSGAGKSSIVRAGLIPCLKQQNQHVFVIRSFFEPLNEILRVLSSIPGMNDDEKVPDTLSSLSRRIKEVVSGSSIILFLDQFEDFFTLLRRKIRERYIAALSSFLADEKLPVKLVFVLREDLLAEMSQLKRALPEIFHHEYRLPRLSRAQAARAIAEPAAMAGLQIDEALIKRILDDLTDQGNIDPPQLQIVCNALFDSRDEQAGLTAASYDQLGTAAQILSSYIESVMKRFNAADLRLAKEILTSLISADDERLIIKISDLQTRLKNGRKDGVEAVNSLIEELGRARVVRFSKEGGDAWIELAHEFLIPEVARWLTEEEYAVKRARAVIERAMENYRYHGLLIDVDALDLITAFGSRLALTGEEADLIAESLLNRGRAMPQWLADISPGADKIAVKAFESSSPEIREKAVESCTLLPEEQARLILEKASLHDPDLTVRKTASILLVERFGGEGETFLAQDSENSKAGIMCRAVSLAFVRDFRKNLVNFRSLPLGVMLLVISGLGWVRLERSKSKIFRQTAGGIIGGSAAGFSVGLILGAALALVKQATSFEAASTMLVLISLGLLTGALGGLGISFGMSAVTQITYRRSHWWSILGGTAGGAAIGGLLNVIGVDTLHSLFGHYLTHITGAFEGSVMGFGVSLGTVLAGRLPSHKNTWKKIAGSAAGAMLAGVILALIGGSLFSGSIEIIARSFAESQINLDSIASFFGEAHFGRLSRIVLAAVEGSLFGALSIGGMEFFTNYNPKS